MSLGSTALKAIGTLLLMDLQLMLSLLVHIPLTIFRVVLHLIMTVLVILPKATVTEKLRRMMLKLSTKIDTLSWSLTKLLGRYAQTYMRNRIQIMTVLYLTKDECLRARNLLKDAIQTNQKVRVEIESSGSSVLIVRSKEHAGPASEDFLIPGVRNFSQEQFASLMSPASKSRAYHLLRTYGISLEQYNELLRSQDNACFICQKSARSFSKALAVDHDHVSGEIRGLLCSFCNQRVIGRHRSPDLFLRAYEYLSRRHSGWFVPKRKRKRKKRK